MVHKTILTIAAQTMLTATKGACAAIDEVVHEIGANGSLRRAVQAHFAYLYGIPDQGYWFGRPQWYYDTRYSQLSKEMGNQVREARVFALILAAETYDDFLKGTASA